MNIVRRARLIVLALLFAVIVMVAVVIFWRNQPTPKVQVDLTGSIAPSPAATRSSSPVPTPNVTPSTEPPQSEPGLSMTIATPTPIQSPQESFVGTVRLIIPVAGVRPEQLLDTFTDARSEGRLHDAIDIAAPAGTAVLAAADGTITKLFQSERGGTTIYQLSMDQQLVYYYAHLHRYADGIYEGKPVKQGEIIAYVGDTGNAGAGNYHLHFSIAALKDPKRYWEGTNINPYPLLKH